MDMMIHPPMAGPAENPKLIASLINVTDRVRFSGLLYALRATNKAGRKASTKSIMKKMDAIHIQKVVTNCKAMNISPVPSKEPNMTLKLPKRSVNSPPNQVPPTDPRPKAVSIHPTSDNVNESPSVKYNERKGITMLPARLISVIAANHQTSEDKSEKEDFRKLQAFK